MIKNHMFHILISSKHTFTFWSRITFHAFYLGNGLISIYFVVCTLTKNVIAFIQHFSCVEFLP